MESNDIFSLVSIYLVYAVIISPRIDCHVPKAACSFYSRPGDISIGAVLQMRRNRPTPCQGGISTLGLVYSEALIYAIEKINQREDILQNVTIGYEIRDSCTSEEVAMWSAISLFTDYCKVYNNTKPTIVGLIAGGRTSVSLYVAKVASLYKVPMISWAATSDELSDVSRFPYFYRSVPPDRLQVGAIIDILLKYNWKYVTLVYSEDTYGISGARSFKYLAEVNDICIALSVSLQKNPSEKEVVTFIEKQNKVPKSRVIIVFANGNIGYDIISEVYRRDPEHNITFVASDGWGYRIERQEYARSIIGSLFLSPQRTSDVEFASYFNNFDPQVDAKTVWTKEHWKYWQERFNCTNISKCPYSMLGLSSYGAFITLCVDIFQHVLTLISGDIKSTNTDQNLNPLFHISSETVRQYLTQVQFNTSNGMFKFDEFGDALGSYGISNLQFVDDEIKKVKVGSWNAQRKHGSLEITDVVFAGKSSVPPSSLCRDICSVGYITVPLEENCCYGCEKCPANAIINNGTRCEQCPLTTWPDAQFEKCATITPTYLYLNDPIMITVILLGALGVLLCLVVSVGMFTFREHSLVKATSKELSTINLLGLYLAYFNAFALLFKPNQTSCPIVESLIALCFTILFTPTLLKVVRIYRIFKAGNKTAKRPRFVGVRDQLGMAALMISIQVFIVTLFGIIYPAEPRYLFSSPPTNYIQVYCRFSIGFLLSCVYNFIIISLCCYYAFRARKVPSNFNESKFIGISVYSTMIVSLAAVPVYSTAIHVVQKVATVCMALLLNAFLSLFCIYIPKLYAIAFVGDELNVHVWRTQNSMSTDPSESRPGLNKSRVHPMPNENGENSVRD